MILKFRRLLTIAKIILVLLLSLFYYQCCFYYWYYYYHHYYCYLKYLALKADQLIQTQGTSGNLNPGSQAVLWRMLSDWVCVQRSTVERCEQHEDDF